MLQCKPHGAFFAVKSVNTVIAAGDNIAANAEKCKSTLARDRDPYSKGTIFTRDCSHYPIESWSLLTPGAPLPDRSGTDEN